jgi:hypothetical protein
MDPLSDFGDGDGRVDNFHYYYYYYYYFIGEGRKLHNEELNDLYSLINIVWW